MTRLAVKAAALVVVSLTISLGAAWLLAPEPVSVCRPELHFAWTPPC